MSIVTMLPLVTSEVYQYTSQVPAHIRLLNNNLKLTVLCSKIEAEAIGILNSDSGI